MSDGNMTEKRFAEIEQMIGSVESGEQIIYLKTHCFDFLRELLSYCLYLREELDGTGL